MSSIIRNPSNVVTAGNIQFNSITGEILLKINGITKLLVPSSGTTAVEIEGDVNVPLGHTYMVNGVPISGATFIDREIPSGFVNNINKTFVLANIPIAGSEHVYNNGQLLNSSGNDYSIVGKIITFVDAPDGIVLVSYRM